MDGARTLVHPQAVKDLVSEEFTDNAKLVVKVMPGVLASSHLPYQKEQAFA
jgi:hypothetical protein